MTLREAAKAVLDHWESGLMVEMSQAISALRHAVYAEEHCAESDEIEEVIEAEREACARMCELLRPSKREYDHRFYDACTASATAIRARGVNE